ncbi:MAG: sigma-54-dependent Fis family transcriptional regulator [Oligoflexales bacterium]|nr:sigma-54-dependent Fis family transcriptional regulator [Oligoflexales bacterium]
MLKKVKGRKGLAMIVDDEASIRDSLAGVLSDEGWETILSSSGEEALAFFQVQPIDLVLLDVWMPGSDGIITLQKMKEINESIPIVIMSGHGTIETAVKVTKLGAYDFLEKPLSLDRIIPVLEHAEKSKKSVWSAEGPLDLLGKSYRLVGCSDAMALLRRQIKMIAPRNSWVLIAGSNGTGKELVARNIHMQSHREDQPFVAVNCAAIPEELIESELFGYAKGAFTHALNSKKGKFEMAHKGTLFLDEIGDMSLRTQAKVLRILQEQSFQRLGENTTVSIDVRVIAATNKDLQLEMKLGNFRQDLYYRLNVIPLHMPLLRERVGDVPLLCDYFLELIARDLSEPKKNLTVDALAYLEDYSWPGNVRELRNMMERVCILIATQDVTREDLIKVSSHPGQTLNREGATPAQEMEDGRWDLKRSKETLREARSQFERSFLIERLQENEWNISKTAEVIGIERSNLHRKMKLFNIEFRGKEIASEEGSEDDRSGSRGKKRKG